MACVVAGYEEAVAQEQLARVFAYLDQPEIVLGEPLNNITPHLLAVLFATQTPFMFGGTIEHKHVEQFVWALHREYAPDANRVRAKLVKRLSSIPLERCEAEITAFLDLSFMDAPSGGKEEKPIAAGIAWLIYRFRHEPWRMSETETAHTPLRKLYQELRCWQRENEQTVSNKSDQKKSDWLAALNKALLDGDITQAQLDAVNHKWRELSENRITKPEFDEWRKGYFSSN